MKKIIILFFTLLLISCNSLEEVKIMDDKGNLSEEFLKDKEGKIQGIKTTFVEGVKYSEENYTDDILNGKRKIFYANGNVEVEEQYVNGVLEGVVKTYFENGKLLLTAEYSKGTLTGVVKRYFEDGQLKEEVNFVDNEENGPFKEYHSNGKVAWEGSYINGENEFGLIIQYDELGAILKKMECDTFMGFSKCKTIWKAEND